VPRVASNHQFFARVVASQQDHKVCKAVVSRVAVLMVDVFVTLQFSAQVLFHDVAVFANLLAVHHNRLVFALRLAKGLEPEFGEVREMYFGKARPGTETDVEPFNPMLSDVECPPTALAGTIYALFGPAGKNATTAKVRQVA
jgi:hypothetical protein